MLRAKFIAEGILPADYDVVEEEIEPALEFYWQAWHQLRDDRQFGAFGGCSGIFYSAISRYARDYGIDGSEFPIFVTLIRAMDVEYLDWIAEQKPPERPPA